MPHVARSQTHEFSSFSLEGNSAEPSCCVAAFVVNSKPHTGARPSVRVCVGPELAVFITKMSVNLNKIWRGLLILILYYYNSHNPTHYLKRFAQIYFAPSFRRYLSSEL